MRKLLKPMEMPRTTQPHDQTPASPTVPQNTVIACTSPSPVGISHKRTPWRCCSLDSQFVSLSKLSFCFYLLFNQWGKEVRGWAPVEIAVFLCFWAPAVNE
jgi:hypothetical protein